MERKRKSLSLNRSFISPSRNMVLQNESVDEDLEHFEDIIEETENQADTTPPDNGGDIVHNSERLDDSDSDSSLDEDVSPTADSEDDVSEEANDLLMGSGLKDLQESEITSDNNQIQQQVSTVGTSFPGGYNLRHREPSYW